MKTISEQLFSSLSSYFWGALQKELILWSLFEWIQSETNNNNVIRSFLFSVSGKVLFIFFLYCCGLNFNVKSNFYLCNLNSTELIASPLVTAWAVSRDYVLDISGYVPNVKSLFQMEPNLNNAKALTITNKPKWDISTARIHSHHQLQ